MPCRESISPVHLYLSGSLEGETGMGVTMGESPWVGVVLALHCCGLSISSPGERSRFGIEGTTNCSLLLLLLATAGE